MKKKGKIHYVYGKNFYASCDGNKRMTPGRYAYTNVKADVTCGRCLKMITRATADTGKRIAVQGDIYPVELGVVVGVWNNKSVYDEPWYPHGPRKVV